MTEQVKELAKFLGTLITQKVNFAHDGDCEIVADFIIHAGYSRTNQLKWPEKKELKYKSEFYDHKHNQMVSSFCGSKDCDSHTICAEAVGYIRGRNDAIDEFRRINGGEK